MKAFWVGPHPEPVEGARRDVVPGDVALVGPAQHRVRGQLGAVVRDDCPGLGAAHHDPIELARHPETGDRSVRDERQAFPRAIVHYGEDPEAPAVDHLVVHEVERPALIRR
jgi:hypothetical protein